MYVFLNIYMKALTTPRSKEELDEMNRIRRNRHYEKHKAAERKKSLRRYYDKKRNVIIIINNNVTAGGEKFGK